MRRRIILLAAGLSAYFIGASVNAYLRCDEGRLCGCGDVGWRVVTIIQRPRAAFDHPLLTSRHLVAPVCND